MLPLALTAMLLSTPTPLRLTADVDDAYALVVNPGGLGLIAGHELRLGVARARAGDRTDVGVIGALRLGALVLGGAAAWEDVGGRALYTPSLGVAVGGSRFGLGLSWTRIDEADHGAWALGATWRPARALSLSLSSMDVGQTLGPRPYDVGVATQILDGRLLVSARWRILHGEDLDHDDGRPDVRVLVGVEPLEGVRVAASADLHFRPSIQVGLSFEGLGLEGGLTRFDDDGFPEGGFVEASIAAAERPSAFAFSKVAVFDLSGDLTAGARFSWTEWGFDDPAYGDLPLTLHALAEHEHVAGVLLKIGPLAVGWARLEELRAAIQEVRKAERRVDCVLSAATDAELYLASACTRVAVLPVLPVSVDGVTARFLFLGEALDRLGITPQVVQRGAYKSAPETFTRSAMSDAQREVSNALLDQAWTTLTRGIADGRGLTAAAVEALIAQGTMTATAAKEAKLVDAVLHVDELEEWVRGGYPGGVRLVSAAELSQPERPRWGRRPAIALITIDQAITGGESEESPFGLGGTTGADTIVRALEAARADGDVRAVVLRVDSPGGDAVASDVIARAVKKLGEAKPVIVSMGDVAASGGYYVAAPARAIFAEPGTITGSIGIFSLGFSVERLFTKLGIFAESMFRGAVADRGNGYLDQTAEERQVDEREIDVLYRRFLGVVAEGRKRSVEDVRALAEGRVWTGQQALERGLVDELGGLVDALRRARVEAGLPSDERVDLTLLPPRGSRWPEAARRLLVGDTTPPLAAVGQQLPPLVRALAGRALAVRHTRAAAMLPFVAEVR